MMNLKAKLKSIKDLGGVVSGGNEVKLPPSNSKFDSFMNNVSRLPRLFLLFGVCAILIWPVYNAAEFMQWTTAVNTIPADLWYLIFIIVTSWAGTKFVRDIKAPSGSNGNGSNGDNTKIEVKVTNGRFDNLDEDDDEVALLAPENRVIEQWKSKNASDTLA